MQPLLHQSMHGAHGVAQTLTLRPYCVAGAAIEMEGMEDDLPSPRTLRAAAERLAQYTSEQPFAGPAVQGQGFADVFSEVIHTCPRPWPAGASCPLHYCFCCTAAL